MSASEQVNLRLAFVRGAEWANGEPFPEPRGVKLEAEARYPDPKPPTHEDCSRCDGCGWYEGGKALQTGCEECGGTGRVEARDVD